MKKCKKCGSKDFFVNEMLNWKAFVDDEGDLQCHNINSEIENIFCENCEEEYQEKDFNQINFN